MKVPLLSQLALESVANYIRKGIYNNTSYSLDSKCSNAIFKIILNESEGFPSKLLDQFISSFNLTELDLKEYEFDVSFIELVGEQNLESLTLFYRNNGEWPEAYQTFPDSETFPIALILESMLNKESRETLKYLNVGADIEFSVESALRIGLMLPNLESLFIPSVSISTKTFKNICNSFPNLKTLDITNSGLPKLDGISKLKYLEVLNLVNLSFDSPASMMDLFGCINLRVLDISNLKTEETKVVKNYLGCEKSLPGLKFLDCSGTDIDRDLLRKLTRTHRNLEKIVVLETLLSSHLRGEGNLPDCVLLDSYLDCLKHYLSIRSEYHVSWMLSQVVLKFLLANRGDMNAETATDVCTWVCKAFEILRGNKNIFEASVKCMHALATEANLARMNTQDLVTLFHQLVKYGHRFLEGNTSAETHNAIWDILNQQRMLQLPIENVRNVCWYAKDCIMKFGNTPLRHYEWRVLRCFIPHLQEDDHIEFYLSGELLDSMLRCVIYLYLNENDDAEQHREIADMVLAYIYYVSWRNNEESKKIVQLCHTMTESGWDKRFILILLELCEREWSNDWTMRLYVLKIIGSLISSENFKKELGYCLVDHIQFFVESLEDLESHPSKPDAGYCAMVTLSLLIDRDFYHKWRKPKFWRDLNTRMKKFCASVDTKAITVDLFVAVLVGILRNSSHDGPIMWALLTIKMSSEKSEESREQMKKWGFYTMVQELKADTEEVMKMRMEILSIYNKFYSV